MTSPQQPPHRLLGMPIPSLRKGSFAWNLSFASGKSVVTILAQLVFTPIIVKLYAPEDYGAFGFLMATSTMLLQLATLQYDKALFLAREERDIGSLRALSNLLPLLFAIVITVVLLFFRDPLLELGRVQHIGNGIFLVPLLMVVGAWSQTSQRMVQVRYRYKEGFLYGSTMVVGAKLLAIAHGVWLGGHYLGLAIAELFNRVMQQVVNDRLILKDLRERWDQHRNLAALRAAMRRHIGFPKYELPSVVLGTISSQLPLFWIPRAHGLGELGQYALASSLLEMPMRLFGYSLSGTFYQKAAVTYREQGGRALARITYRMMAAVGAAAVLPLLVIALAAEPLFAWLFGPEWAMAGKLSAYLSMFYFARLLVEPISSVLRVIGRQRSYLRLHATTLVVRAAAIAVAMHNEYGLADGILLYAAASASIYVAMAAEITIHLERVARRPAGDKPLQGSQ